MKNVCVLGNGQLGRMLHQAGEPLGINVFPVGIDAIPDDVPYQQAIITAEIERWPETDFTRILANHPNFVNREIFPRLADRYTQKQLLDQLSLPTAPWYLLSSAEQWPEIFSSLGSLAIVKRRTGGYDGRGQWRVKPGQENQLPDEIYGESIVEQGINFSGEVSLVGARNAQDDMVFYPLTHNLHQDGILRASFASAQVDSHLQTQAEKMLSAIMHELNYVGVMAMECFIVGSTLLINELAPRVHNSGHWTQNGSSISQFELHLRAILNLPIPKPIIQGQSVMINLIGTAFETQWLTESLANVHWYHKDVRAGRKVGHININHDNSYHILTTLYGLQPYLTDNYLEPLNWLEAQIK